MPCSTRLPALRRLFTGAVLVLVTVPGGVSRSAEPTQSPSKEPPWRRMLSGADEQQVKDLEKQLNDCGNAGQYKEAQAVAQAIVKLRARLQGDDHWQTVDARRALHRCTVLARSSLNIVKEYVAVARLRNEAHTLSHTRRYAEALPLYEKVLDMDRRLRGEDDDVTAYGYANLADALCGLGRHAEETPLHRKALAIRRRVLGPEHPLVATSCNALANTLKLQRKHSEAEPLFREALAIRRRALGENHAETTLSYQNLAGNLQAQGNNAEAESLRRTAREIQRRLEEAAAKDPPWRRMLSGDDEQAAKILEQQESDLLKAGKFEDAQKVQQAIVELRTRLQGAAHWQTADARRRLEESTQLARAPAQAVKAFQESARLLQEANQLFQCQKHAESLPLFQKLLKLALERKDEPLAAISSTHVGSCLLTLGKPAEAARSGRQALAISRRVLGEEHPTTVTAYALLGTTLYQLEQFREAEPLLRQAWALHKRVLGEDHPTAPAICTILLACLARLDKDRIAEAETLAREALVLLHRRGYKEDGMIVSGYLLLGLVLNTQGKYAEAEPLLRKALAAARRVEGEQGAAVSDCCEALGENLSSQDRQPEAEALLRRAVDIRRQLSGDEDVKTAEVYYTLAWVLFRQDKTTEAEQLYRKTLKIYREKLGEQHASTSGCYNNLALVLGKQGKHGEAEQMFRKAVEITGGTKGQQSDFMANHYASLGGVLADQGKYAEAEQLFRQALAIQRRVMGEFYPHTLRMYTGLAMLLTMHGKHPEAEVVWTSAAHTFEGLRLRHSFGGLDRARFSLLSPLPELAVCLAHNGKPLEAWKRWEANLARGLLDDLTERPLTTAERSHRQNLVGQLTQLDKQLDALRNAPTLPANAQKQMQELRDKREALHIKLLELEAELSARYGVAAGQVFDLQTIQAQLAADAALLSWVTAETFSERWACIVRSTGLPIWVKLSGTGPSGAWSKDDTARWQKAPREWGGRPDDSLATWQGLAQELAAQQLTPLEKHLQGVHHLIVLASGNFPIEPLTDRYRISYAPSGTMYAWLQVQRKFGPPAARNTLLTLGDPAFRSPPVQVAGAGDAPLDRAMRGETFAPLPGTRQEVEAIARLVTQRGGKVKRLLGSAASEEQLETLGRNNELRDFAFLHLATHGKPDPHGGLNSYLALAQDQLPDPAIRIAQQPSLSDGRLTAGQILRTWKLDAELVTLSACETGMGQYQGGEGYVGFAQALFLAGARSLVLSLWQVDDRATALLMTRFYENLLGARVGLAQPLPKAAALAEGKHWLRNLTAEEANRRLAELPQGARGTTVKLRPVTAARPYAHPYYWAPFLLIGDPGNVTLAQPVPAPPVASTPVLSPVSQTTWPLPWLVGGGVTIAVLIIGMVAQRLQRRPGA